MIGVATKPFSHWAVFDVKQIPKERFDQVEEFFVAYNKSRGKKFKVQSLGGPKDAVQAVETGIKAFQGKDSAPKE